MMIMMMPKMDSPNFNHPWEVPLYVLVVGWMLSTFACALALVGVLFFTQTWAFLGRLALFSFGGTVVVALAVGVVVYVIYGIALLVGWMIKRVFGRDIWR